MSDVAVLPKLPEQSWSTSLGSLPLVPFERLMLADDRPQYPMTYVFEFVFQGQIDRAAWTTAWQQALARHPLLTGLVDQRRSCWHWPAGTPLPVLDWADSPTPLSEEYGRPMDLYSRPGLHGWVRQAAENAVFTCQFHHACCDGMGTLQFCQDVFSLYAQHTAAPHEPVPASRNLQPERLRQRATFGLKPIPLWQQVRDTFTGISEAWKFLRPTLQRLTPSPRPVAPCAVPGGRTAFTELDLSEPTVRGLRNSATRSGATLNDLLMRDLFLVLQAWDQRQAPQIAKQPVRVMMPCNMRLPGDESLPAANVVSYAFLTREVAPQQDPTSLLAGLAEETQKIRQWRLALYFAGAIGTALAIPYGLRTILSPRLCMATAYLSNLGDLGRHLLAAGPRRQGKVVVGNLLLQSLTVIPPVRPNTRVGVVIVGYAQQLRLCVKFDPWLFSAADQAEFMQLLSERLHRSAHDGCAVESPT